MTQMIGLFLLGACNVLMMLGNAYIFWRLWRCRRFCSRLSRQFEALQVSLSPLLVELPPLLNLWQTDIQQFRRQTEQLGRRIQQLRTLFFVLQWLNQRRQQARIGSSLR
ncbi:MAG: hypothetical protein AAGG02_00925 [Cyanobacteria bacterium P01_H01_bin.15]